MKENEDKFLEKLVDTIMKDSKLEKPSLDFTAKVMSQVYTTKTSEAYVYNPLISNSVWIIIFVCVTAFFSYVFINGDPQTERFIGNYFSQVTNGGLSFLFELSKITLYSVVIATFMLFIQISFLKKHFDNQLEK